MAASRAEVNFRSLGRDKKALHGLTFVLDGAEGVEVCTGVERDALDEAFAAVGWAT